VNTSLSINLDKTDIELFISIISFILNNSAHPKIKESMKLFFKEEIDINRLKKVILGIDHIRKFLELPQDLIMNQIKYFLLEGKVKKCNSLNLSQYNTLAVNLLRCVIELGYGN